MEELSDQQLAANWAKEILNDGNWAILDTETTGLDGEAEICQIAAIDLEGNTLFDWYVKTVAPIPKEATAIHGIADEVVQTAKRFDEIFVPMLQRIGNRNLLIYNAEFDLRMLRQSAKAVGFYLAFPTSDRRKCRIFLNGGSINCVMLQYSQWVGDWSEYHGNYKWQRLPGGDHSAFGDCKATLAVIKRMAQGDASDESLDWRPF